MYSVLPDDQLAPWVIKAGLANEKQIAEALQYAKNSNCSLYEALLEKGTVGDEQLGQLTANIIKVPFVVLAKLTIPEDVFNIIPPVVARKQKAVAFARGPGGIKIALANPAKKEVLEMVAKKTGQPVLVHFATLQDIQNTLHIFKPDLQAIVNNLLKEDIGVVAGKVLEDPPVVKLVDILVTSAYDEKASDIHIEPEETSTLVRFRIDGILNNVLQVSKYLHDRIITRIKVLSNLRTDEHLAAQDGKMRIKLDEENLDIRVSIVPVADGEKAVLRLLSSRNRQFTLSDLGMSETDLKKVSAAYTKSYGMILSTGPTGSGKTTSIYSILKILNTREKNITTIEDPIEYRIKGANQIQVNVKTNLTFANGLRSILRQDPNIVFVGEIRDNETAKIAVNAALTGHLVLSTLHTNDAATAIPRLIDMQVEPFLVASTVTVIIAQRLVRQVCTHCKQNVPVDYATLAQMFPADVIKRNLGESKTLMTSKGAGCKVCRSTGYIGRIGLFEVLEITEKIRRLITDRADADVLTKAALEDGMIGIIDDGLKKVAKGLTSLEEVQRVTKAEFL
ncbi:MAG: GspE/PulE family protein [bacterium]|nr:GspE/PulE family protein [bacterium]